MPEYLKTARTAAERAEDDARVRATVETILSDIEARGDAAVRELSARFDRYEPADFRLTEDEIAAAIAQVAPRDLEDIRFAQAQIRRFAQAQRATMQDLEIETLPRRRARPQAHPGPGGGLLRARRQVPDGGLRPHVGSDRVRRRLRAYRRHRAPPWTASRIPRSWRRCTSPARPRSCASAACRRWARWRSARSRSPPVDMLVGPGKRLRGRGQAPALRPRRHRPLRRPHRDAGNRRRDGGRGRWSRTDLLGQAEHGPTSPAVLITNSRKLALDTLAEIERLLAILPTADIARVAWGDYGEVILCETYEEMLSEAERIASEHVQVMTDRDDWFLANMTAYGALFLGPRTNVANGDKVIGTNHTLPTKARRPLHRRALGGQVPEDAHLPARPHRRGRGRDRGRRARGCACWKASSGTPSRRTCACAGTAAETSPTAARRSRRIVSRPPPHLLPADVARRRPPGRGVPVRGEPRLHRGRLRLARHPRQGDAGGR